MQASSSVSEENDVDQSRMPVSELHGSITITVLAKPGAKQTAITEITSDGVSVQIAAPARDGDANAALVAFIAKVHTVFFNSNSHLTTCTLKLITN